MRPEIRSDNPQGCLVCMCVCLYVTAGVRGSALEMAEGQGDIGAITLMKKNEGYSCRRWKERQGHRQRDKKTEW